MRSPRLSAALFVLVGSAALATSGPLARVARPADPLLIASFRVLVAAVFLTLIDLRNVARDLRSVPAKKLVWIALAGAVLGAHFAFFLGGLDRTSLPAALSLVSLEPLSVVVFAWLFFRVRPTRGEQLGVLLATAGAVVVAQAADQGDHRLFGDLLVIVAVLLFGLYVAAARALQDALPPRTYAAAVYASAALTLSLALLVLPSPEGTTRTPPATSWLAMLGAALIPTLIGHTSVQTAARTLPPATVALVCPGETLGGIAIGLIALHAAPKPLEWAGAAIILTGALVAILSIRPAPRPAADVPITRPPP